MTDCILEAINSSMQVYMTALTVRLCPSISRLQHNQPPSRPSCPPTSLVQSMRALSKSKFVMAVTSCDAKGAARYLDGTNEPFRGLRRPTGRKRSKERKDDQGRNDRVVQIGPDGLAASAHVMGCPQDRAAHWGYRTYQMLLLALIEVEKQLDPWEFNDCA